MRAPAPPSGAADFMFAEDLSLANMALSISPSDVPAAVLQVRQIAEARQSSTIQQDRGSAILMTPDAFLIRKVELVTQEEDGFTITTCLPKTARSWEYVIRNC